MRLVCVVIASTLVLSGCATSRVRTETPAASAGEQWISLRQQAERIPGHRAFARVQWQGRGKTQGFDATLLTDDRGRLLLEGLTPLGTTAATLWTDGATLTFLNHRARTWWTGPLSGIPETAPLVPALRDLGMLAASSLLFGYPPGSGVEESCETTVVDAVCRRVNDIDYHVTAAGLARAHAPGAVATFPSPSVPATSVQITTSSGTLTITNRMIEEAAEEALPPQVDPSWRCCVLPSFE